MGLDKFPHLITRSIISSLISNRGPDPEKNDVKYSGSVLHDAEGAAGGLVDEEAQVTVERPATSLSTTLGAGWCLEAIDSFLFFLFFLCFFLFAGFSSRGGLMRANGGGAC